jgi:hypothetical protein
MRLIHLVLVPWLHLASVASVTGQPITAAGQPVQTLVFEPDGNISFALDTQPVLGMGEGGPLPAPGSAWRSDTVQFDRPGQRDSMDPGGGPTCTGRAIPRPPRALGTFRRTGK